MSVAVLLSGCGDDSVEVDEFQVARADRAGCRALLEDLPSSLSDQEQRTVDGSSYAEANCGPTAVAMVLEGFGIQQSLGRVRAQVLDSQRMWGNNTGTLMTALAGALYCQYQMFISPDTVSGIGVSLQIVFAVVAGGIYVALGPTAGAIITILLNEALRIGFGTKAVGYDNLVYGMLLVLFIIFLPKGTLGSLIDVVRARTRPTAAAVAAR